MIVNLEYARKSDPCLDGVRGSEGQQKGRYSDS